MSLSNGYASSAANKPRLRWVAVCIAFVLVAGGPLPAQQGTSTKLALVGGMLLDGYETPPIHHAAVVIIHNPTV